MKRPRLRTLVWWILGIGGVIALFPVHICRVYALVDCHTGSRLGYCRWAWGSRTGEWYKASAVETFMHYNHPTEFRQRLVSYQGNGMNIFGVLLDRMHGSPGPILSLHPSVIDEFCLSASDKEKRRIYDVLAGGDEEEIRGLVEEILVRVIAGSSANSTNSE